MVTSPVVTGRPATNSFQCPQAGPSGGLTRTRALTAGPRGPGRLTVLSMPVSRGLHHRDRHCAWTVTLTRDRYGASARARARTVTVTDGATQPDSVGGRRPLSDGNGPVRRTPGGLRRRQTSGPGRLGRRRGGGPPALGRVAAAAPAVPVGQARPGDPA